MKAAGMISVVVPVYNMEKYLEKCIDSLIDQSYSNLEIILVDDGSSDSSGIICDDYSDRDSRIKVVHQNNGGVSSARNAGLDICSGEYVSFVDPDDWIDKGMFQRLVSEINANNADFAVCNEVHVINSDNGVKNMPVNHWKAVKNTKKVNADGLYRDIFSRTARVCNKVFTRELVGGTRFDTGLSYGEDGVFLLDIISRAASAVIVPDGYYYYSINRKGNVVSSEIDKRSLELLEAAKSLFAELKARGYTEVGVNRILTAVREVMHKIDPDSDIRKYREYIEACRKTAKTPGLGDLLNSVHYIGKRRFLYLFVCRFSPASAKKLRILP